MKKKIYKFLLKKLLKLYGFIYQKISALAIRYYGFHPKHKFEDYHKFFLVNIPEGAKVLDVGCSRGELTIDIAKKSSRVVAYDISKKSIEFAKRNNSRENIYYFIGEATRDMPNEHFDVTVCSNILEHLSRPKEFLRKLRYLSERILVRVPNIDNNWIAGLKRDLGMNYFIDAQHNREYTAASIREELEDCGWQVESMENLHELRILAKRKK